MSKMTQKDTRMSSSISLIRNTHVLFEKSPKIYVPFKITINV